MQKVALEGKNITVELLFKTIKKQYIYSLPED
jgi:hypothetical protein